VAPIQRQAVQPFGAGIGRFHEPQGSGFLTEKGGSNDV
jgi:cold shock CspA family protein